MIEELVEKIFEYDFDIENLNLIVCIGFMDPELCIEQLEEYLEVLKWENKVLKDIA